MITRNTFSEKKTFLEKIKSIDYILVAVILLIGIISCFSMYSTDGGVDKENLNKENVEAVKKGSENLLKHIENLKKYGVPIVVGINAFVSDTEDEMDVVRKVCEKVGIKAATSKHWEFGGDGAVDLANEVVNTLDKTKSNYILTTNKYSNFIPKKNNLIIVKDVLLSVSIITKLIYPKSLDDNTDDNLSKLKLQNNYRNLKHGNNVLLGKNVLLGSNCYIGHNTIIESNVKIGNNCVIGSNVIIKNSIIGNGVRILDGAIIGKKGFGFFPSKNKNLRYPHIGMVIIGNNVEIGCNNTIDRGSLSNTMIGENTYLDNQIHIAHNVQIGKNCIITAQVGFAGSAKIGNKVMIGEIGRASCRERV